MIPIVSRIIDRLFGLVCIVSSLLVPAAAIAGTHTWDINEVFTNADGTIQFVELREANGTPNELGVPNQTLSSNSTSFTIGGGPLVAPTSNKFFLIATPAFAALPGAPVPDAVIPPGSIPFFSAASGDTISYGPYDSLSFGPGVAPTNGVDSLARNLTTGPNSPTNYAGDTGSVDAGAPPALPLLSPLALGVVVTLLAVAGATIARRNRWMQAGQP
jgi:hypothetical protein